MGADDVARNDVALLNDATGRAVKVARALRLRMQTRRLRGSYASLTGAARDVVGHFQAAMADDVRITLACVNKPAVVSAEWDTLRMLIGALVEMAAAHSQSDGAILVEVTDPTPPASRSPTTIQLSVHCDEVFDESDPRLVARAQLLANAVGSFLRVEPSERGGSALRVDLVGV
jgi:hypothetical protein